MALKLGWLNPDAMMEAMPWRVFVRWMEYDRVDPFGEWRADYRAALGAWASVAAMADKKGRAKLTPEMFIPEWGKAEMTPEQEQQKVKDKIMAAMSSFGGTTVKVGGDGE